jgi:rSAM/selenodomain-associated transferase 2
MKVSVIIPVLNEEAAICEKLPELQWVRDSGHEIIVVDGGSTDGSVSQAKKYSDVVISSEKGRAAQMNAGAGMATGELLLFLHVDTQLPQNGIDEIQLSLDTHVDRNNADRNIDDGKGSAMSAWGRFDVRLSGKHFSFRIVEFMMNWRSRLTGIATGDQAIFVTRPLFNEIGGYLELPLMEDIDISRRLKNYSRPICISDHVVASSRRWETLGIYRTVLLMWRLRLSYWLGVDPVRLAKQYYR